MRYNKKRGQVSVQFHWIFIIIAGAIILAFFVGVVFKQKDISEQKISIAVVSELEPILAGAGVAEDTFNKVDIPRAEIEFICSGDYSEYSVKGTGIHNELPADVIFSPEVIEGTALYIWTLGWEMPFDVVNFVMITGPNIRYVIVYDDLHEDIAYEIYEDLPGSITKEAPVKDAGMLDDLGYDTIRFVYVTATGPGVIPSKFAKKDVSAVWINPEQGFVEFYEKIGNRFATSTGSKIFPLDDPFTDKDAMLYSAIFSGNAEMYECAMKKAYRRLVIITDIIESRARKIELYYTDMGREGAACAQRYNVGIYGRLHEFRTYAGYIYEGTGDFKELRSRADALLDWNDGLLSLNCILMY